MSDIGDAIGKAIIVWIIIGVAVSAVAGWAIIEGAIWLIGVIGS